MAIRQPLDVQTQATSEPTVTAEVDQDIIQGTGQGADTPEEWRNWIDKGNDQNLRQDLNQQGIDESIINDALGPPGGDQKTSTETPADAGVSGFMDEKEYVAGMGPALRAILKGFKPKPAAVKTAEPLVEVKHKPKGVHYEVKIEAVDPAGLSPEEIVIRTDKEIKELLDSDLADYDTTQTHQPNFDVIDGKDDVKAVIAQMAESFSHEIDAARGPVLHHEQLQVFARELGTDPKFIHAFLVKEFGEGVNQNQILAARAVLEASARKLKTLGADIKKNDLGPEARAKWMEQFHFHRQWMMQFMGARATAGRTLGAFNAASPAGVRGTPPGPLPQSQLEEMLAHRGGAMDFDTVLDQVLANDTLLGVNKTVKDSQGGMNKFGAAFIESFIGSLLSGIKTQVANFTGNSLMTVKGPLETAIAARMGMGLPSDGDRVIAGEAMAMIYGMQNGFQDAYMAAWTAFKSGEPYGGVAKFELPHRRSMSSEALGLRGMFGWMADAYGPVARAPMERLLGPMDAFFKIINERAAHAQLSYREVMRQQAQEGLTDEETVIRLGEIMANPEAHRQGVTQEITDYGLYTTFQNPLGPNGRALQKIVNSSAILKTLSPFIRTPINILKVGFGEMTGLSLLQRKYKDAIKSGTGANPAYAQNARARLMMGASIMTTFAIYAMSGKITGSGPRDSKERATLMATGWRPRSIRWDHKDGTITYVPYGRFEPASLPIGAIADVVEVMKTHQWDDLDADGWDHANKVIGALVFAISENTINKTYMQGVNSAMKGINDYERYGSRWITQMANSVFPLSGLRRDVRKLNDEYLREAITFLDKFKAVNPFFSEGLPTRLDIWGEPEKYETFLNPHSFLTTEPDAVDIEIRRLLDMTGENPVTRLEKKLGGSIDLTAEQYHDMMFFSRKGLLLDNSGRVLIPGQTPPHDGPWYNFKEYLGNALFQSERYLAATDFGKVKMIKEDREGLDEDARAALLESYPDLNDDYLEYMEVNPTRRELGDDAARPVLRRLGMPVNF
tara:strand:- start:2524 stop:5574 length:3051 start_codon:yes stop_codon:yes gene_type:complete